MEEKSKKRFKKRWIVLGVVGVVAALGIWRAVSARGSAMTTVETADIARSNIEEIVSISGTVESAETSDCYAELAVRVSDLPFKAGDRVKKGDLIVAYDTDELEIQRQTAELNLQQADGNYDDSISKAGKAQSKKAVADRDLPAIQAQIDETQAQIDALNEEIKQKQHRMAQVGTQLSKASHDINQNGKYDGVTDEDNYLEVQDEDGNEMYLSIQNAIADNQLAQSHDEQIMGWNKQIEELNETLTKLNEQKTELKSDQSAGESAELTSGGRNALEAQRELARLTNEKTLRDIDKVGDGVKAEYNGVLTEVNASKGATMQAGTKLFSIASTDRIKVTMSISKSDMSKIKLGQAVDVTVGGRAYEGEVSWIAGAATRNSSNVPVVAAEVTVKNPDDAIILGVEASMKIHTRHADDVLVVPYEYVNTDTHGDFVYVVEDGTLLRRDVQIGITTSTDAEIMEGLSDGDQVVTSDASELQEGMPVQVMHTGE